MERGRLFGLTQQERRPPDPVEAHSYLGMLGGEHLLQDRHRLSIERDRLGGIAPQARDLRQVREHRRVVRIVLPACLFEDLLGAPKVDHRFVVLAERREHLAEGIERRDRPRVIPSEGLFGDVERAPQHDDGLFVAAHEEQPVSHVVEKNRQRGVVRAESFFRDRERLPVQIVPVLELALIHVRGRDAVERARHRDVIGTEALLVERERTLKCGERFVVPAQLPEDDAHRLQAIGLDLAVLVAESLDRDLCESVPLERRFVLRLLVADEVHEVDPRVRCDLVVTGGNRRVGRLVQGCLRALSVLHPSRGAPHLVQGFRLERQIPHPACVAQRGLGLRERLRVLSRFFERFDALQREPRGLHYACGRRVLRRQHARFERRRIGALVQSRERLRCFHRALDHLRVGVREELRERGGLTQVDVETFDTQVEELLGLLATKVRRLAGFGVHLHPRGGVPVEDSLGAFPGIGSVGLSRLPEGALHLALAIGVPHPFELSLGTCAHEALLVTRAVPEESRCHDAEDRDRDEDAPPYFPASDGDGGEHLVHRRITIFALRAHPSEQHAPHPRGHFGVLGGRLHAARNHLLLELLERLSRERSLPVEALVESHREVELIGAVVRRVPEELFRRHVRRRTRERARSGERRHLRLVLVDR